MASFRRFVGLAFILGLGCGDDGGGGGMSSASTGGTDSTEPSESSPESGETSNDGTTGDVEPGCGDGIVEGDEECDDGDMNSDADPDACRSNCELPTCGDGVVDGGEECDEGLGVNSDYEPDTCRYECTLPVCGDGVTDTGERCDDGNDAFGDECFECSDRFYFILNAPAGDPPSILRTTRDGPAVQIVGGDASLGGIVQLAIEPDGTSLYALQSDAGTDRVLAFDAGTGEQQMEIDVGMGAVGYDPTAVGVALGNDGKLYVAADAMGTTRIVQADPSSGDASEFLDLGSALTVADMTADASGGLYLSTGAGGTIERVDITMMSSATFADGSDGLANPSGLTFDTVDSLVWTVDHTGGPVNVFFMESDGTTMLYTTSESGLGSQTRGLVIDIGDVVAVTATEQNRVAGISLLGVVSDQFTEMVMSPTDIELVELGS